MSEPAGAQPPPTSPGQPLPAEAAEAAEVTLTPAGDGGAPAGGGPEGGPEAGADGSRVAAPLAPALTGVPEPLLAGYLDAALAVLRRADPAELPGALRGFQTWAPKRLRSARVLALVKRALETDAGFRGAVDELVLTQEAGLAGLLRAGRHAEALASGESPAAVATVGLALGPAGTRPLRAAIDRAEIDAAQAKAERSEAATAEVAAELQAARQRLEQESAAARAAREQARAGLEELRRSERERRRLQGRVDELERQLRATREHADALERRVADERRRLQARLAEQRAAVEELRRANRALRRPGGADPAVAEALASIERDLAVLRRAAGIPSPGRPGRGEVAAVPRPPERRRPLPVPAGRTNDDPEALLAWAQAPGVLVLVDGYNVTKQPAGFAEHSLEDQRTLLVARCRRLARRAEVVIVFDGAEVGPLTPGRMTSGGIGVVFTDPDRIADDEIIARVNAEPPERPVVVVSSDREVRDRALALGANSVPAPALLALAEPR
ncbi:MAG TPA: NYN domain-containing protein [Actinomycetes bacterium]|nr:NYN domain-containing protein [Actinomycetes bacterium]